MHAQWTALRWALQVLLARGTNPHYSHCKSSWNKTWKDPPSWATWILWPGMEATRSGWQEMTPPLPTLPSSYLISSDFLPPTHIPPQVSGTLSPLPSRPCKDTQHIPSASPLLPVTEGPWAKMWAHPPSPLVYLFIHINWSDLMMHLVPASLPISCPGPVSFNAF